MDDGQRASSLAGWLCTACLSAGRGTSHQSNPFLYQVMTEPGWCLPSLRDRLKKNTQRGHCLPYFFHKNLNHLVVINLNMCH